MIRVTLSVTLSWYIRAIAYSVPKTGIVYVLGDVSRPGGFPMSNNDSPGSLRCFRR